MTAITGVEAWEVLDSRGHPTVRVRVLTDQGSGEFTTPAGASVGTHEAVEMRDGSARYRGLGVRNAVQSIENEIAPAVTGRDVTAQRQIDTALEDLDGTADLSRLGANAILGVSGAVARAGSAATNQPLYELFDSQSTGTQRGRLPMPMVNVLSGGLHAAGRFDIQDILVLPVGAKTYSEAVRMAWEVRISVRDRIEQLGFTPLLADEGGFAPPLDGVGEAFELVVAGIRDAGYEPGTDVTLGLDMAMSQLYDTEREVYVFGKMDRVFDSAGVLDLVETWLETWPIASIEDPLAEDDWTAWTRLSDRVGDEVQLIGDDLVTTDLDRLSTAIDRGAINSVLIKPNQAGTITRAIDVAELAQQHDLGTVVSARSGETCDATIADLAVGLDAGQIKIGSLARSERLAKYNRLLAIESEHDGDFAAGEPRFRSRE